MGFWPVVKHVVKNTDIVLEIADARMPYISRNRELEKMIRFHRRKYFLVFNKIDLVSGRELKKLRDNYKHAFFVSGNKNIGLSKLKANLLIEAKKLGRDIKVGVVGYPNVGKSAVINALGKRAKAKTSRVAGTTKGIQWIKTGNILILDSPGVVPIKDSETKLGILGAKNPEKIKNLQKIVFALINELGKEVIEKNYKIKIEKSDDETAILEKIGRKRGFLLKKGIVDENRTYLSILRDWQKGKIGM